MKKHTNLVSRVIAGGFFIILGGIFAVLSFSDIEFLIYSIPLLGIGMFLFFNDKEDDIEQIKK